MTAAHALGAAVCKDELLTPSVWGSAARLAPGPAPEVSSTGWLLRYLQPLPLLLYVSHARVQCIFGDWSVRGLYDGLGA